LTKAWDQARDAQNQDTEEEDPGFQVVEIVTDKSTTLDGETLDLLLPPKDPAGTFTIAEYDHTLLEALDGDRLAFSARFPSINAVRSSRTRSPGVEHAKERGQDATNTVGPMTLFTFRCINAVNGCKFKGASDFDRL
jgi:hypothetical protein